jgi:hypothetical protein
LIGEFTKKGESVLVYLDSYEDYSDLVDQFQDAVTQTDNLSPNYDFEYRNTVPDILEDENGNPILDEDGNRQPKPPEEGETQAPEEENVFGENLTAGPGFISINPPEGWPNLPGSTNPTDADGNTEVIVRELTVKWDLCTP